MEPNSQPHHTLTIEENASESMEVDPKRARFPCCIVWTPLPVLSWFIPFIGHLGICREDGVILDFAGPNYVCVDNFAFGAPTCYFQIGKEQLLAHLLRELFITVCYTFDENEIYRALSSCGYVQYSDAYGNEDGYEHDEPGRGVLTWDEILHKSTQEFQHQSYNLLTCNCHSFVANCLNRLKFRAGGWNVVNLAIFIFLNGKWVSKSSIVKSYLPFLVVFGLGIIFGGTTFITCLAVFIFLLIGWFVVGTYCFKKLIYL